MFWLLLLCGILWICGAKFWDMTKVVLGYALAMFFINALWVSFLYFFVVADIIQMVGLQ